MAAVQDRTSLFGKDILSRMLDMEKLSQVRRESKLTGATILTTTTSSNNQSQVSTERQQTMPQRSAMAPPAAPPRSRTTPNLKLDLSRTDSMRENVAADQGPEPVSPSICHSPTWSVRGKEKGKQNAKKAAKEKKETEKKNKKEEEKRKPFAKPGKRLSKKPPPAMETQRLPVALSRPSESTASRSRDPSVEDSRPSSKEGRRSSMSSITSMMRITPPFMSRHNSYSQPSSPAQEYPSKPREATPKYEATRSHDKDLRVEVKQPQRAPVRAEVKQSPEESLTMEKKAQGQKARTPSNGSDDDDASYLKELKEFAYQLNGNVNVKSAGNTPEATRPLRGSPLPSPMPLLDQPRQPSPVVGLPMTESQEERPAVNRQPIEPLPRPDLRAKGVQDNTPRGYHYPSFTKTFSGEGNKLRKTKGSSPYSMAIPPTSSAPGLLGPNPSSYVRKQRLSQQQRSISGFQEELAVTQAMLQASIGPNMPPTPAESMESLDEGEGPALKSQDNSRKSRHSEASVSTTAASSKESTSRHESLVESTGTHPQTRPAVQTMSNARPQSTQVVKSDIRPSFSLTRSLSFKSRKSESQGDKSQSQGERLGKSEPTPEVQNKDGGRWFPLSNNVNKRNQQAPESTSKSFTTRSLAPPPIPLARSTTEPVLPTVSLPLDVFEPTGPLYEPEATQAVVKAPRDPSPEVPSRSPLRDRHRKASEAISPKSSVDHGQPNPEVVVQGVDGDGLVRQTSIKRSRSDPELNVDASVKETQPALDFLPQLKHQPLVKPKRMSGAKVSFAPEPDTLKPSSQFPVPASALDFSNPSEILALPQPPFPQTMPGVRRQSAIKASKRSSFPTPVADPAGQMLPLGNKTQIAGQALSARPIAKMFVICCKCKYWHDLPSSFYEAMAVPRTISQEDAIAQSVGPSHGEDGPRAKVAGRVFTTVKCPWCEHGMSTACCAGWTSIVYLHERHH